MRKIAVGLNGFGRIGRAFTRIALQNPDIEIRAINTAHSKAPILAHLLKYDSVYRTLNTNVEAKGDKIVVGHREIACYNFKEPSEIPWDDHNIDVVIDCTGAFKTREDLQKHIKSTVQKVIVTAPVSDESIEHVVLGVNSDDFDFKGTDIISNASCTTNCAAIMTKVLDDAYGIKSAFLTTVHAYTSSQELLDDASKNETRSRAATLSIIPTTTGAASAICKTTSCTPDQLGAIALRVPVPVGSISDMTCLLEKETSVEAINALFKEMSEGTMQRYLGYEKTPLVSSDYIGSPFSCTFDPNYTQVLNGNFVKIFGWYDNEWGYSNRLVDLVSLLSNHI
ncbi:MAG: type I glyceraldehyde-3-phosphate dehydrogenase [Microgenomates group bacterium]